MVKNQLGLRYARRLVMCQAGITILFAAIVALFSGQLAVKSVLLGGLVNLVPNAFFAMQAFRYRGARASKQIVNSFYKGEALKMMLTMVMFAMVFIYCGINPLMFFAAYIMAQMVFWFSPLIFVNKQNRPESD